ncbi:iron-sulfur cluster insertion protein ErpA [Buchnera aphidicola]|uniref:Iron-sulfur cluster insertion protein ErpA n=1 Tax=Buchnera aphidicola (Stegophylla sp.) TaxID=2315800 RepID=A0A4D6Y9F6_9GAMM|nr:iron-sulfur cluster insertion protein ErpA [Buchnera aphidicola (Stegophylla sp.)]QCI26327.1 iron-sulfur cluster insertion protein ErpA [Buchnera aphidicola (Stegophylla sp.)]
MINTSKFKLQFTQSALNKINKLLGKKKNQYSQFRIYITGGGCSGFQYNFKIDKKINSHDIIIKYPFTIVIDPISFQYLIGGKIDYQETLSGSKFIVSNPNAKTTCGCGLSFSV